VDFHNKGHTNVYGSLKFSKVVGDYLVEYYGFEDKRGLEGWEKGYKAYMAYCTVYTCLLNGSTVCGLSAKYRPCRSRRSPGSASG